MSELKQVLVTGANRGIGLGIVKLLLKIEEGGKYFVWLGARSLEKANATIAQNQEDTSLTDVEKEGWANRVKAIQVDVTDQESVANAVKTLEADKIVLNCLVNNAGIALDLPWDAGTYDNSVCAPTLAVNYYGVKNCFHAFKPLLHETEGRVVSISSGAGNLNMEKMSPERQQQVMDEGLTEEGIDTFIKSFQDEFDQADAKELPCKSPSGWHLQAYGFSKAMVNAFTRINAATNPNLLITCCTPGFVDTDMVSSYKGDGNKRSVEEGAQTPLWLISGNKDDIKNGHMYGNDQTLLTWVGYNVIEAPTKKEE